MLGCAVLTALLSQGSAATAAPVARVAPSQELAVLLRAQRARARPSAGATALELVAATTPITDGPTVLPVLARRGQWLEVRLPGRPNGHVGWIRREGTVRAVTDWHVVVDTFRRLVIVYRSGRPERVFRAVVGGRSTPTPTGQFYVEESIALRAADVGAPFALALSARSEVLQRFAGGPGQIALHGLGNIGGRLGTAVSHGCVRLDAIAMGWLVTRVGPGTPVTVTD